LRQGKRSAGTTLSDVNDTPDDGADDELVIEAARNGWGLVGQAGYLVRGTGLEIVARGALNRAFDDSSMPQRNEYGLGVKLGQPTACAAASQLLSEPSPRACRGA
jgi:hypothetical protein